jgi:hypothetical protein
MDTIHGSTENCAAAPRAADKCRRAEGKTIFIHRAADRCALWRLGSHFDRNENPCNLDAQPIFARRRELRDDEAALLMRPAFAFHKERQLAARDGSEVWEDVAALVASEQADSSSHLCVRRREPNPHRESS